MRIRGLFLLPLLLAGCASPSPKLYTLGTVPGRLVSAPARVIELRHIGLARYLDRPGIVERVDAYRMTLADDARWAEPLPDMLARVLAADLGARLSGSSVFTAASPITATPDRIIEIDIQRFDAEASFDLIANVAIQKPGATPRLATFHLSAPAPGGEEDQIATMSRLLGELADHIAEMLEKERQP